LKIIRIFTPFLCGQVENGALYMRVTMIHKSRPPVIRYAITLAICGLVSVICLPLLSYLDLANIIMLYLLAVVLIAVYLGRGPAVLAAFVCVALFDFLFVQPRFSFSVHDGQYLVTFMVMLVVALLIGHLVNQMQEQVEVIRQQEQQAKELITERLRSSILSALSHGIRTPLTVLCGLADTLKLTNPDLSDQTHETVESMRMQALRLHGMVDNLLEMARLQSGNVNLRKEWQPLEEVIGASIHGLSVPLSTHPVTVSIAEDAPLLNIDSVLMERVFCNILENACKYSPENSAINIKVVLDKGNARVTVHNEGSCFPIDSADSLLNMFERGRQEAALSGFGIGLAICRSIVDVHGGKMQIFNHPKGGACVSFTLPIGMPPAVQSEKTPAGDVV
jgi:two-component system sensor histidine kinase KdpD